jgi:hypothetical protein
MTLYQAVFIRFQRLKRRLLVNDVNAAMFNRWLKCWLLWRIRAAYPR